MTEKFKLEFGILRADRAYPHGRTVVQLLGPAAAGGVLVCGVTRSILNQVLQPTSCLQLSIDQPVADRLVALTAHTRTVRQDEITTELLDAIIGFEARKDREKRKRTSCSADHTP